MRPKQWYLDKWKIDEVWKTTQGEGVTVALIDSGVDSTHPDLVGQVVGEPYGTGDADSPRGHGTGMASLIAGTGRGADGKGIVGVAPKTKIVSYNVVRPSGGVDFTYEQAVRMAADSPAKIISVSKGDGPSQSLAEAFAYAQSRGKLVVAASGNRNEVPLLMPPYPAGYPGVLGVGGYSNGGKLWDGSVQGYWVSLAGPAEDVPSACTGPTRYCIGDGTSAATALTSGVAALLWAKHPDYTANQIIKVLTDSANKPLEGPVPNDALGYGNVSPRNALNWTGDPGPPDVNPLVGKRGNLPTTAPSGQPAPSTAPSAAPAPASTTPAADTAADAAAGDDDGGGSDSLVPVVGILVGGVAVLTVIVWVYVRSRTKRRGPPGAGPPPPVPTYGPPPPPGPYR
ncbi:S8 family serine peptidase [Streptodolium elevatio]|uniref:S8 family serine peptidase n=1 Tax=Streptodolium elevatio TaxID=3157996 RepID=A0ABV3DP58_9ACTN